MKLRNLKSLTYLLLAFTLLTVFSCDKNLDENDSNPILEIKHSELGSKAGNMFVSVKADGPWKLQMFFGDQEPWAELNIKEGIGNKNNVILSYKENVTETPREMELGLYSGGHEFIQKISQHEKSSSDHSENVDNVAKWLELPSNFMCDDEGMFRVTHYANFKGKNQRNYTILYDSEMYTSYWVAYPLCRSHIASGRHEDWKFDPKIDSKYQTSVNRGYGVSLSTEFNSNNFYARGHQIPNADRSGIREMQYQTYYSTNITPQIHKGFNENIWAEIEGVVRSSVKTDTVYVVTGACFQKAGEAKQEVKEIKNHNDGKLIPVPNYYWKVLLKVRRDGANNIVDAKSIGFWLPHSDLTGKRYASYITSVDQIEKWTGFDLFTNLPEALQNKAETQKDWSAFYNF